MDENIYDFYSRGIIGVIIHGHVIQKCILLSRARGVDFVEFVEQDGRPEYLSSATATASSGERACTGRTGWRARILVEQYDVNVSVYCFKEV